MTDWTAGYVADIGYTYGYYAELNPLRIELAFLNAGLAPPSVGVACELGFGQGLSTNLHAAASVTHWLGTDFNPGQAAFAGELASASGSGARLYDEAFADFAARADLPDFDFIALHGIWSWISDENRAVITKFIRKKLKVGGVLYISYNTQPGWGAFASMRHLLTEHADVIGAEGQGIVNRIDSALNFADRLIATNPLYARANPQVAERLARMKSQNRQYLAHEYFNRDWHPMHFSTMAEWLEGAKVQYACSASFLDQVDAINLSPDQAEFLREISDPMFRETVRDFMVNQQFRRDYWVKGLRRLNVLDQAERVRQVRVLLTTPKQEITLKVKGTFTEGDMNADVYLPLLDCLSDYKPKTLGQLEQSLAANGIPFGHLLQAVIILSGQGHLYGVQADAVTVKAKKQCDRINSHLMARARGSDEIAYLASPITGGGYPVGRFQQMFLLAITQGKRQPAEWAHFAWQLLQRQGQKLIVEGNTLMTPEENLTELTVQAESFATLKLPIIKALQII